MKKLCKKYPKRIIITALVVLLVAIVGTVNNYQTYWDHHVKEYYLDDRTVKFMQEIYGDVTVKNNYYSRSTMLYYRKKSLETKVGRADFGNKFFEMKIDSANYTADDTVTVRMENKLFSDVSFYEGKYLLQICDGAKERYFDVYSGVTAVKDEFELISIRAGETYEIEIPLTAFKNVKDEPITLIPGTYKLSIPLFVLNNPEYQSEEDSWLSCSFKIK